ncbi:transcription factor CP2-like protein 1 isoform X1 [Dermacentor andersoni]|uniref:transcription factor CP2-like protein 1 isoform X1 n=1 Tax=Dermacentor andersoni TaxID=34620 RepID=UPI002155DCC5|nr:transcription factor CP2-like protein 1 isoform X1 [Dermacentor andersoni]XP_050034224.1 transcription factor CP2-like protein 1 isoform X1 [Dermacentor andersoni]XP_054926852.1 transcription factor CP2-like protein 1 isoform X1 [Dermacentor andersoni]
MTSVSHWQIDDIDDALAADFDGSLSGLGMELGTASFNMSDALLALPSLASVKQEMPRENGYALADALRQGPASDCGSNSLGPSSEARSGVHGKKNRLPLSTDDDVTGAIKRFCVSTSREPAEDTSPSRCRHSSSAPDLRMAVYQPTAPLSLPLPRLGPGGELAGNVSTGGFQYFLGAATSIATKLHEETMTYLNQGQSYEIKLKKLGDLTEMRGKMLKSTIRIGFQERRLQYMEKEQITQWMRQRPGERILEADVPLSYGVYEVVNTPNKVHFCEFLWDPTKETGVFVRLNCISTEFTPKKHGGEKGVPFRIVIETYSHGEPGPPQKLHSASCQVKVFKPKGADRKHKTDREKMIKRPLAEQEKHQPSYDCTVFTECISEPAFAPASPPLSASGNSNSGATSPSAALAVGAQGPAAIPVGAQGPSPTTPTSLLPVVSSAPTTKPPPVASVPPLPPIPVSPPQPIQQRPSSTSNYSPQGSGDSFPPPAASTAMPDQNPGTPGSSTSDILEVSDASLSSPQNYQSPSSQLSSEASASETSHWLQQNRFANFTRTFASFSGADILRLTRDDLIQICGLADGIRLFNALHSKTIRPRLTAYVCLPTEQVFRAVYLRSLTVLELLSKLTSLCNVSPFTVHDIYIDGPSGIHVLVTDEVVRNMPDESMYAMELLRGPDDEVYSLLLKSYGTNTRT